MVEFTSASKTSSSSSSLQPPVPSAPSAIQDAARRPSLSTFKYPSTPESTVHAGVDSSVTQISGAYRRRYASYLAASFGISLEAALAETDQQLAPRRASSVSEDEVYRRE